MTEIFVCPIAICDAGVFDREAQLTYLECVREWAKKKRAEESDLQAPFEEGLRVCGFVGLWVCGNVGGSEGMRMSVGVGIVGVGARP